MRKRIYKIVRYHQNYTKEQCELLAQRGGSNFDEHFDWNDECIDYSEEYASEEAARKAFKNEGTDFIFSKRNQWLFLTISASSLESYIAVYDENQNKLGEDFENREDNTPLGRIEYVKKDNPDRDYDDEFSKEYVYVMTIKNNEYFWEVPE